MPLALARKYRPKRFADVAVQSHVSTTLQGAIARGRVAHGYLLCGPRGVGKTTLARVLAMALNCERRTTGEPCGECPSCVRTWSGGASLDVVEIDAASNRGVDDARELRERAMYAPSGDDRYKVYIVDEAHMLTREAWNALLKILEEPPPRVVFVFATTEPQKIAQLAAPVLSRLQRFDFKRIGASEIRERLTSVLAEEGVSADAGALAMIARAADGSMRDALSLTDQVLSMGEGGVTADRVRESLGLVPEDEFLAVLDLIADRRAGDVFAVVARLADAGVDLGGFLTGLTDIVRAQLAITLGGQPGDLSERAQAALIERRERLSASDLLRMLAALGELEPRFRKSGQQQLLLETILVRLALLDRAVELEDVLRQLGSGTPSAARGASGGGTEAAARTPRVRAESTARESFRALTSERADSLDTPASPDRPISPVPPAAAADRRQPAGVVPDLAQLAGRWDDLVNQLRSDGRQVLAGAMQHGSPAVITAAGELTIALDEPNAFLQEALEAGHTDLATALQRWFPGITRVHVRAADAGSAAAPKRLTDEMLRQERIASLRKRDPVLGAAIDALDLDVLD